MDKRTYEQLRLKLDEQMIKLKGYNPVITQKAGQVSSGLFITKDMDVNTVPEKQLPLMHTMLHMFYGNNSGMGLSRKSIENLHKQVSARLKDHTDFDKLDEL